MQNPAQLRGPVERSPLNLFLPLAGAGTAELQHQAHSGKEPSSHFAACVGADGVGCSTVPARMQCCRIAGSRLPGTRSPCHPGSSHRTPTVPASLKLLSPQTNRLIYLIWDHLLPSRTISALFHTVGRSFHSVDRTVVAEKVRGECSPRTRLLFIKLNLPTVTATAALGMPLLIPGISLHKRQLSSNITVKVPFSSNHHSFLITTKSYFMSIKHDVEGFLGVGKGFAASFYLLIAGNGLLNHIRKQILPGYAHN